MAALRSAAGVLSLPDDTLLHILDYAGLQERWRAAQACQRFRHLISSSRTLWRAFNYEVQYGATAAVKLESFLSWLTPHHAHIEQVDWEVGDLALLIAAIGNFTRLQKLHILLQDEWGCTVADLPRFLASVATLTSLEDLMVHRDIACADEAICVETTPLSRLTNLTSLCLGWHIQSLNPQTLLPALEPSLRVLELEFGNWEQSLALVSCLKRLESISMSNDGLEDLPPDCLIDCFATMRCLTAVDLRYFCGVTSLGLTPRLHTGLQELTLEYLSQLPSLPLYAYRFANLKLLSISHGLEDDEVSVSDLLAPLARPDLGVTCSTLQSLTLDCDNMDFPTIILQLHGLTHLCLHGGCFDQLPSKLCDLKHLKDLQLVRLPQLHIHCSLLHSISSLQSLSVLSCGTHAVSDCLTTIMQTHANLQRLQVK